MDAKDPWDFESIEIDYRAWFYGWRWWIGWLIATVAMAPAGLWLTAATGHGMGTGFNSVLGGFIGIALGGGILVLVAVGSELKRRRDPLAFAAKDLEKNPSPIRACRRYSQAIGGPVPRSMRWSHVREMEDRLGQHLPRLWLVHKPNSDIVDEWMDALADPDEEIDFKLDHPTAVGSRLDMQLYVVGIVVGLPILLFGLFQGWSRLILYATVIPSVLVALALFFYFNWRQIAHAGTWLIRESASLVLVDRDTNLVDVDRRVMPAGDVLFVVAPDPEEKAKTKRTARLWIVGESLEKPLFVDLHDLD